MSKSLDASKVFGIHVEESDYLDHPPFLIEKRLEAFVDAVLTKGVPTYGILKPSTVVCGESGINFIWESSGDEFDVTLIHYAKMILINLMSTLAFSNPAPAGDIFKDFANFSIQYDLADILLSECLFEESFPQNLYTNQDLKQFIAQSRCMLPFKYRQQLYNLNMKGIY